MALGSRIFNCPWLARFTSISLRCYERFRSRYPRIPGDWNGHFFNANYYQKQNPDIRLSGLHPFVHYLRYGEDEGRQPHPFFDPNFYATQLTGEPPRDNLLLHFVRHGHQAGYSPHPIFEPPYKEFSVDDPFCQVIYQQPGRSAPRSTKRLKITQFISSLGSGGAERQLSYLSAGLKARAHDVRVVTWNLLEGTAAHFLPYLEENQVKVTPLPNDRTDSWPEVFAQLKIDWSILAHVPPDYRTLFINLVVELQRHPVDILTSWMDTSNCLAGWAGLLTDVPQVFLFLRSVNPSNFPHLNFSWLRHSYIQLLKSPRIRLVANSHAGAASYAQWLECPPEKIDVIHNGLDFTIFDRAKELEPARCREELELPVDAPVIGGVLRLSSEKRPLLFAKTVRRVHEKIPDVHAVLAGAGPMEGELREYVERYGMGGYFHLLGQQNDVATILRASDALLLVSENEGFPNVLLEAQYLCCPPVSSRAGGSEEVMRDGETGYLVDVHDEKGLADRMMVLLKEPELRKRFAAAGTMWVQEYFSRELMVDRVEQAYIAALRTPH